MFSIVPSNNCMFIKNTTELKEIDLCPFLAKMDTEEQLIQSSNCPSERQAQDQSEEIILTNAIAIASAALGLGGTFIISVAGALTREFTFTRGILTGGAAVLGIVSIGYTFFSCIQSKKHKAMFIGYDCRMKRLNEKISKISRKIEELREIDRLNKSNSAEQEDEVVNSEKYDFKQLQTAETALKKLVAGYESIQSVTTTYGSIPIGNGLYTHFNFLPDGKAHVTGHVEADRTTTIYSDRITTVTRYKEVNDIV